MNKINLPVQVAGIINLTPDSFFAESRCATENEALKLAERFLKEGADFLDVGAESSRPGSLPISEEVELQRLAPVVTALVEEFGIPVSVDAYKPDVVQGVLDAGAAIINDITGLRLYPETASIVARYKAKIIVMHMQGTPATMQIAPVYQNVVDEVIRSLKESIGVAKAAGIDAENIIADPGIGFGKNLDHNLDILRSLDRFQELKVPIMLGLSRKSFLGDILDLPVEERLEGSLAAAVFAVQKGVQILRVHDVKETVRAVKTALALINELAD